MLLLLDVDASEFPAATGTRHRKARDDAAMFRLDARRLTDSDRDARGTLPEVSSTTRTAAAPSGRGGEVTDLTRWDAAVTCDGRRDGSVMTSYVFVAYDAVLRKDALVTRNGTIHALLTLYK